MAQQHRGHTGLCCQTSEESQKGLHATTQILKDVSFLSIAFILYYQNGSSHSKYPCPLLLPLKLLFPTDPQWGFCSYFNLAYIAVFAFPLSFPQLLAPYHTVVWDFLACWQASEKHPSPAGSWTSVLIGLWLWLWHLQMGSQSDLRSMPSKRHGKAQK